MVNEESLSHKQGNEYDKIFKENMEQALPGLIEHLLGLHIVQSKEIPDDLQHTKERKPDVLKKVTDVQHHTFILHIEWQVKNEKDMVYRMAEYRVMLLRKYQLPVKQYVLFIGSGRLTMPYSIDEEDFVYRYRLIALSQVDYKLFLQSDKPEEKLLAILANFGNDDEEKVLRAIVQQIQNAVDSDLASGKYFNQLRVLAQLRNLPFKVNDMLDSIDTFFKAERDPFYKMGEEKGKEEGEAKKSYEVVVNALEKFGYNDEQAASIAGVSIEFVKEVRQSLKK